MKLEVHLIVYMHAGAQYIKNAKYMQSKEF